MLPDVGNLNGHLYKFIDETYRDWYVLSILEHEANRVVLSAILSKNASCLTRNTYFLNGFLLLSNMRFNRHPLEPTDSILVRRYR